MSTLLLTLSLLPWPVLGLALALSLMGLGAGLARLRQPVPVLLRATATPAPSFDALVCPRCGVAVWDQHGRAGHACNPSATIRPQARERSPLPSDFGGTP